jgi:Protein of unknown function (DUF2815)
MTMPLMKDTRMPDDWIIAAVSANPFQKMPNGSFCTCPVRLAFVHVMKPNPDAKNDDGTPKATPSYEVTALCPPGASDQINATIWPEVYQMIATEFPNNLHPQTRMPFGIHNPLARDQAEKPQYKGYTAGLPFLRFTTQFKPQVVDPAMNPIVDDARVYAGAWAILNFNMYIFGKSPPRPKKGVSLGLQSVMIIADDDVLSGGAAPPQEAFAGIKVQPKFDAARMMQQPGAAPPPPGAAAQAMMPPPMPVGNTGYAPPPPPPAAGYDPDAEMRAMGLA